jgi:hypothetical protein
MIAKTSIHQTLLLSCLLIGIQDVALASDGLGAALNSVFIFAILFASLIAIIAGLVAAKKSRLKRSKIRLWQVVVGTFCGVIFFEWLCLFIIL